MRVPLCNAQGTFSLRPSRPPGLCVGLAGPSSLTAPNGKIVQRPRKPEEEVPTDSRLSLTLDRDLGAGSRPYA